MKRLRTQPGSPFTNALYVGVCKSVRKCARVYMCVSLCDCVNVHVPLFVCLCDCIFVYFYCVVVFVCVIPAINHAFGNHGVESNKLYDTNINKGPGTALHGLASTLWLLLLYRVRTMPMEVSGPSHGAFARRPRSTTQTHYTYAYE